MIEIHSTCFIDEKDGSVEIDDGTAIGPFCHIKGPIKIGKNNKFESHCSVGLGPEHREKLSLMPLEIGDSNFFSNHVSIHRGTDERPTRIMSNCYVMNGSHISHDCLLEDNVTLSSMVTMGGHVTIQKSATVGMNTCIHQFSTIGAYSMIGMSSSVTADVLPFILAFGSPARKVRMNDYQLKKLGIDIHHLDKSNLYNECFLNFKKVQKRKIIK